MKELFTKLLATLACGLLVTTLAAQIPNESPIAVDVILSTETGFSRQFEYSSMADFGVPLRQTVSGLTEWARDNGEYDADGDGTPTMEEYGGDSLNCSWGTTMDLTGKMALVRRGACFFSQKIYNAQAAGAVGVIIIDATYVADGGGLINMAGADSLEAVNIPAVFLTRDDGDIILARMEAGEEVTMTFQVRAYSGAIGPYAHSTPQSQILPLDEIQANFTNLDTAEVLLDVGGEVEIVDPMGTSTVLNATIDTLAPDSTAAFLFDDYMPSAIGEYTMTFTNDVTDDVLSRTFEITDFTYTIDNTDLAAWPTDSWIAQSNEGFVTDNLRYDFGSFYLTGPDGGMATHVTFALGNPDSLYTGDPDSDVFTILIYDADEDMDGVGPLGSETSYDDIGGVVGFGAYILDGTETEYQLLTVELDEPVALNGNGQYMVMVQYDGINAGLGIPPWYMYSGNETFPYFDNIVFSDQLYMGGWAGNFNGVIRLHMEGFTNTDDIQPLADSDVTVMPNPTSEVVQLQFDLQSVADNVTVALLDLSGKVIQMERYDNILDNTLEFNVSNLAAGTYFFAVRTPEGYSTEKFVVVNK